MSANEKQINEAFDRIEKSGIRFDVSKHDLSEELQKEIAAMADGSYSIKPKEDRDFEAYMKLLPQKRELLLKRIQNKDSKYLSLVPKKMLNCHGIY